MLSSITIIIFASGIILGFFISSFLKTAKNKTTLKINDSKSQIEIEVMQDHIKQLESKVKTLEKALELSSR
ncbi:MAG: hypothetical protein LW817_05210 [Candidatus Caenarcaniphilales bacterium]|jgi:hypothetical protein|nr:hypothetical protein [Candidatus Caenarcaniphilales bacterium]